MIPTPDHGKLSDEVYEPAEDTFLLLDTLEDDADELRTMKPFVCLEIGSGSGVVSTFLAKILVDQPTLFLTTDINPDACLATANTASLNNVTLHPTRTSVIDGLSQRLHDIGGVDVLVFNPPYVPTDEYELEDTQTSGTIGAAWAGGSDGMGLTSTVLDLVSQILSAHGRFYLVAVKQNDPEGIIAKMREKGLDGKVAMQRRAGRESLYVLRFQRSDG